MRKAAFAGTLYEKGEVSLQQQIQECFEGPQGPGALPPSLQNQKKGTLPKAILVPNARYDYSGACAAWGYKALGEAKIADVYIILASSKEQSTTLTQETFETPLGMVRVDQDLARRLLEKGNITENIPLHNEEYGIEVQLPFLQMIHKDVIEKIKILPILVGPETDFSSLAVDIKEILLDTNKQASFIVSTNFTHYGRNYRYLPFTSDIAENIAQLDKGALDLIKTANVEGLLSYVDEKMMALFGTYAVALLLKTISFKKAHLEQYYTSTSITKDEKNSVSYAAIRFD